MYLYSAMAEMSSILTVLNCALALLLECSMSDILLPSAKSICLAGSSHHRFSRNH